MIVDKALLPKKVYLSGADCFHLVLDKHAKKHGAGGNVMRKIFYFNKPIGVERISSILKRSAIIHWLCNIKLVEGKLFSIPFWEYTDRGNEIIIREYDVKEEKQIPQHIVERDITLDSPRFIEADILHYPSGASALVISWNHVLLDAKGSSLLLSTWTRLHLTSRTNYQITFLHNQKKYRLAVISRICTV